jgi:hypothetical protein
MNLPEEKTESWKMCNLCSMREYKDGLCQVHWAHAYSCVPAWDEKRAGWVCKNCGWCIVSAESLKNPCPAKAKP